RHGFSETPAAIARRCGEHVSPSSALTNTQMERAAFERHNVDENSLSQRSGVTGSTGPRRVSDRPECDSRRQTADHRRWVRHPRWDGETFARRPAGEGRERSTGYGARGGSGVRGTEPVAGAQYGSTEPGREQSTQYGGRGGCTGRGRGGSKATE